MAQPSARPMRGITYVFLIDDRTRRRTWREPFRPLSPPRVGKSLKVLRDFIEIQPGAKTAEAEMPAHRWNGVASGGD
jgi:hypothetical protein